LSEIKTVLQDYGTKFFTFWDDSFSLNIKVIKEICERIIQEKIRISWRTATRADLLDPETLSLMKKSGCFQLELGVETGSKNMAKKIKKDLDLDAVSESIKLINRAGIASGAFFMAGFPEETEEDIDKTFDYIKSLNATEIVLNVFDPMPGSEIYEDMIISGQLKQPIDWLYFPLWPNTHFANKIEPMIFNEKINRIAEWIFSYNSKLSNRIKHLKPKVLSLMKSAPWYIIKKGFTFFK
ncbi:radical SAM protein, partial [bacterium]|nr:radical SAM protein [bacterium]